MLDTRAVPTVTVPWKLFPLFAGSKKRSLPVLEKVQLALCPG